MDKNILILLFIIILMFSTPVSAQNYTCLDENTSYFYHNISISGNETIIEYTDSCPFGCFNTTGQCNPNPYETSGIEFFILPIIAVILLYLGKSLSEEDWGLHFLLLLISLILIVVTIGLLLTRESATGNILFFGTMTYVYWFLLAAVMFIIFYYMIKTALKVLFAVTKK